MSVPHVCPCSFRLSVTGHAVVVSGRTLHHCAHVLRDILIQVDADVFLQILNQSWIGKVGHYNLEKMGGVR